MQQCKTVRACIALALTDAYGDYEEASAWLAWIQTMFSRFDKVKILGEEETLHGFDLGSTMSVVASSERGSDTPESLSNPFEFPKLTPIETRWLNAWMKFARGSDELAP